MGPCLTLICVPQKGVCECFIMLFLPFHPYLLSFRPISSFIHLSFRFSIRRLMSFFLSCFSVPFHSIPNISFLCHSLFSFHPFSYSVFLSSPSLRFLLPFIPLSFLLPFFLFPFMLSSLPFLSSPSYSPFPSSHPCILYILPFYLFIVQFSSFLYVFLYICLSLHLSICLSLYLSIYPLLSCILSSFSSPTFVSFSEGVKERAEAKARQVNQGKERFQDKARREKGSVFCL